MGDLISDSTNDLISRQDAIRVANGFCHPANVAQELAKLPSAQSKREKGVWKEREILSKEDGKDIDQWQCARCSECGRYHTTPFLYSFSNYNFCPHCGAKMSGGTRLKKC